MDKSAVTLANGTEIAYLERAGGELPLVLLHGITDNARTYEPLLAGISPRCRVFALDFRGHGESAKPETLYDADAYADDVRCFIQETFGVETRDVQRYVELLEHRWPPASRARRRGSLPGFASVRTPSARPGNVPGTGTCR